MQALSLAGEVSQGELGRILAMDSTTLTRTLTIMGRNNWIARRYGKDRRQRLLRLSVAGRSQFRRTLPRWEKVQSRLRRQLGNDRWRGLVKLANQVTNSVTEE